jgi:hypothetical protein
MSKKGSPAKHPAPPPVAVPAAGERGGPPALRRALARLSGARLCYGKPVRSGDRVVVPVAQIRAAGGYGFGTGSEPDRAGDGGGGGGSLRAKPVGFIELGPDGACYHAIPESGGAAARTAALAGAATAGAAAGFALAAGAVGTLATRRRRRRVSAAPGRRPPRRRPPRAALPSPRRSRQR